MWLGPLLITSLVFWISLAWCAFSKTVLYDGGGPLQERLDEMKHLNGVRIEGECYSACTLYLSLPETCVTPTAKLGFHSPLVRLYGAVVVMPRDQWERTTRLIGEHYPPAIREWWMRDARYEIELQIISGAQAIKMGAKECETP